MQGCRGVWCCARMPRQAPPLWHQCGRCAPELPAGTRTGAGGVGHRVWGGGAAAGSKRGRRWRPRRRGRRPALCRLPRLRRAAAAGAQRRGAAQHRLQLVPHAPAAHRSAALHGGGGHLGCAGGAEGSGSAAGRALRRLGRRSSFWPHPVAGRVWLPACLSACLWAAAPVRRLPLWEEYLGLGHSPTVASALPCNRRPHLHCLHARPRAPAGLSLPSGAASARLPARHDLLRHLQPRLQASPRNRGARAAGRAGGRRPRSGAALRWRGRQAGRRAAGQRRARQGRCAAGAWRQGRRCSWVRARKRRGSGARQRSW